MTDQQRPPDDGPARQKPRTLKDNGRDVTVFGLVLSPAEMAEFLVRSACEYNAEQCEEYPCDVCDPFVRLWHDVYQSLSARHRFEVEDTLSALDQHTPRRRDGAC